MFSKVYRFIIINTIVNLILDVEIDANYQRAEDFDYKGLKRSRSIASYYPAMFKRGEDYRHHHNLHEALEYLAHLDRESNSGVFIAEHGLTADGAKSRTNQANQILNAVIAQLDDALAFSSIHDSDYNPDDPHMFGIAWHGSIDGATAFKIFNRARRAYNKQREEERAAERANREEEQSGALV